VVAVLLGTGAGPLAYGALSGLLPPTEAVQRAALFALVMIPLYAVAGALLLVEKRPARADRLSVPAGLGLGAVFGLLGFGAAVGLASLLGALAFGAPPPPIPALGFAVAILLTTFQVWGEEFFFRGWLQPALDV